MYQGYNRDIHVGILGREIIPKSVLDNEGSVSLSVARFLLFIQELNQGRVV